MRGEFRPLTAKMIEFLMECHEREILKFPALDVAAPHATGLLQRNLVTIKKCVTNNGREYRGLFISDNGKKFLDEYCKNN